MSPELINAFKLMKLEENFEIYLKSLSCDINKLSEKNLTKH